jgi:DNA repair protein RecO (recombination protein O)
MSDNVCLCQPAFVLHQQHYRETSYLVEVLTRDFGKVSLIAKGVRQAKSKTAALLRPFCLLNISYMGRAELKTLTTVEAAEMTGGLLGIALFCGYYLNELLHHLLHKHDPHPELFYDYQACLTDLVQGADLESALRNFEFNLMEKIGYGLRLDYDGLNDQAVMPERKYFFDNNLGLVEDNKRGLFSGEALLAMQARRFSEPSVRNEAKLLSRTVIDLHLQGKPLKSRHVLNDIIKRL